MDDALSDKTAIDEGQADATTLNEDHQMPAWREVFLYFLMLGFINVGGPVAQITMMYNHMLTESPRLFMHFWANDDAQKLACGLRAALDKMNIRK